LPNNLSIVLKPGLESYAGKELAGIYPLDAEGVVPKDNLVIVKDGILINLLNSRTPSKTAKEPHGNSRILMSSWGISVVKAPGVVHITNSDAKGPKDMKKLLIDQARKEGLEYAYIIRKATPYKLDYDNMYYFGESSSPLVNLLKVFKVSVATGEEILVRSCEILDIPFSAFKHILSCSKKEIVFNTMLYSTDNAYMASGFGGCPVSIIMPQAFLFEELDLMKKNLSGSKKPPIVANPVK
jgi:hypothetical protein